MAKNRQWAETSLEPEEEMKFQEWKLKYAPKDSGQDYDLRGAFKAGVTPNAQGHWPDTFKKPNHPTFSNESMYKDLAPQKAGSWEGEKFIPPKAAAQKAASSGPVFSPDEYDFTAPVPVSEGEKQGEGVGKAFLKGLQHELTLGYTGEFEPQTTGENVANIAGRVVGFAGPALALSPMARLGTAGIAAANAARVARGAKWAKAGAVAADDARKLAAIAEQTAKIEAANKFIQGATSRATLEGVIYGGLRKPEGEETRLENVVKDAALFGGGVALFKGAGKVAGKIMSETGPYSGKVMNMAREFQLAPEQAEMVVKSMGEGKSFDEAYNAVSTVARELPGGGVMELKPKSVWRQDVEGMVELTRKQRAAVKAEEGFKAEWEIPPSSNLPMVRQKEFRPEYDIERARYLGAAATRTPAPGIIEQGIFRPTVKFDDIVRAKVPSEIPEFNFPSSKRPEFTPSTPKLNTLYKQGLVNEMGEITPEGARYAGLFNFFRPAPMDAKVLAAMEKIPTTVEDLRNLPRSLKNFVKNEVHGPIGAAVDSFRKGKDFSDALEQGLHSFARERRLELDPMELKGIMEEVVGKSKISMQKAKEILPALDAEMPAMDLAKKASIPPQDAEAIIDELAANIRGPLGETVVRVQDYVPSKLARNVLGDEVISPEVLDRALTATEITPEQFKNAGFLRPDGTLDERGKNLLNMLNPEWRIPYSERVIDKPPKPARVGSDGRKLEAFDVNSPEGRIGLASIRAGGKGTIPLGRGTIEGFLPMSVEEAMGRKFPLVRKVPGGYQFTEKGAALAATRKGGIVKEIDLQANRQYELIKDLETGEVSVKGGRGGKSYEGYTEEQIAKADLDYQAAKEIVIEYRENTLSWKGCPED